MDLGVWGTFAEVGIVWAAELNEKKEPNKYQVAYSTPNYLNVETGDNESFGLGGIIASENTQKLRVERFGKNVTVSVNGRKLFDKEVENGKGKVGIFLSHGGNHGDYPESISISIKSFKVWK